MLWTINWSSNIFLPCLNRLSWASWGVHTRFGGPLTRRWMAGLEKDRAKPWSRHQGPGQCWPPGREDKHVAWFCSHHCSQKCLHLMDPPYSWFFSWFSSGPSPPISSGATWWGWDSPRQSGSSSPPLSGPGGLIPAASVQTKEQKRVKKEQPGALEGSHLRGKEGLLWCLANN